jgi:hypothetical protein
LKVGQLSAIAGVEEARSILCMFLIAGMAHLTI